MYTDILEDKIIINKNYCLDYNFDPTWNMQSLLCDLVIIPRLQTPYVPKGAQLTFSDSKVPQWVGVRYKNKLIGAIPKGVLDDYSVRGFIMWSANYHIFNLKPIIWMELK